MFLRLAIPTLAALAVLTASPVVHAADMPLPAPAPAVTDNWYLRGYVGVGMTGKPPSSTNANPANSARL